MIKKGDNEKKNNLQLREKINNQDEIKGENIAEDQKMKDKIVGVMV